MFDTRNSSGCGFDDQVVAYLYREMAEAELKDFEGHLALCAHCSNELEAISSVSVALNEWKSEKFDPLKTPSSRYSSEYSDGFAAVGAGSSLSFLESLRGLFQSLPGAWQAASAFGVVVIAAGLMWFLYGNLITTNEMAVVPPVKVNPVVSTGETDKILSVKSENEENTASDTGLNANITAAETIKTVEPDTRPGNASKKSGNFKKKTYNNQKKRTERLVKKQVPTDVKQEEFTAVPRLSELAETEDTVESDLRLSDLFAGSDSEDR